MTSSPIFFWRCLNFSYCLKFRVSVITVLGVMTTPNIWRLEEVMNTKFGTNVFNKVLLNAQKCQGCSFYRFWVINGKQIGGGLPPPTQIRINTISIYMNRLNNVLFILARICQSSSAHIFNWVSEKHFVFENCLLE